MHHHLFDLAARQHGVVSHDQILGMGTSREALRTLVGRGALESDLPGVYRVAGAPVTRRQRLRAATLWLPGALVSHRAAADLHGLRGFDRSPLEIVVERWHRRHRPPELLVHETKDLVSGDIADVDGVPCTALVRTLVDVPAVAGDLRAGDAIDQATRTDPTLLGRVRRRHLEVARRGRTGTVRLRRLLDARLDGEVVDSPFERSAVEVFVGAGVPRPVTQHPVRDGSFTAYLDLAWPEVRWRSSATATSTTAASSRSSATGNVDVGWCRSGGRCSSSPGTT